MPTRKSGPYKETSKRMPWEDIFEKFAGDHFIFDKEEYTTAASVRSSGLGYKNRENSKHPEPVLTGVLHVMNLDEDPEKLVVWYSPDEPETNGESSDSEAGSEVEAKS